MFLFVFQNLLRIIKLLSKNFWNIYFIPLLTYLFVNVLSPISYFYYLKSN